MGKLVAWSTIAPADEAYKLLVTPIHDGVRGTTLEVVFVVNDATSANPTDFPSIDPTSLPSNLPSSVDLY